MNFNNQMHPRNIYKDNPPNFKELAAKYPDFKKHCTVDLKGKVVIDFKNSESVRALTTALLENDFGLNVELPSDSLVPRIPLRLNYILWLEDLIDRLIKVAATEGTEKRDIWGIDIGTGASCVYPLLGAKSLGWHFVATEREPISVEVARRNVDGNGLNHLIEVIKVDEHTALCGANDDLFADETRTYDFCMCNPPFYDRRDELTYCASAGRPGRPEPHSATVARPHEVCADGGEVGFVSRIIEDSVKLGVRVRIYTSMLGRKASLTPLKAKLRDIKVADMCTMTFCQGKTQRWALAWTFVPDLPLKQHGDQPNLEKKKRAPLIFHISPYSLQPYTFDRALERIRTIMDELKIEFIETESDQKSALSRFARHSAEAKTNTWSHNRRKRRANEQAEKDGKKPKVQGKETNDKNGSSENGKSDTTASTATHSKTEDSTTASSDQHQSQIDQPNRLFLKFEFAVKLVDAQIVVELQYIDGEHPDALNQVLQFLRNRFH